MDGPKPDALNNAQAGAAPGSAPDYFAGVEPEDISTGPLPESLLIERSVRDTAQQGKAAPDDAAEASSADDASEEAPKDATGDALPEAQAYPVAGEAPTEAMPAEDEVPTLRRPLQDVTSAARSAQTPAAAVDGDNGDGKAARPKAALQAPPDEAQEHPDKGSSDISESSVPAKKGKPTPPGDAPAPARDTPAFPVQTDDVRKGKPKKVLRGIAKVAGVFFALLLSLVVLAFGVVTVICKGPFPTAKEIFVVSVTETSAVKFLARIYFTEEEVQTILQNNSVVTPDEVTDPTIPFVPPTQPPAQDIEIHEVSGSTFKGKMMIIHDPSRVSLAVIDSFGNDVSGRKVEQLVEDNNAIAGINAGGFLDLGGVGKGGQPLGLLIKDGTIRSGSASTYCNVVGLTYDHRLIVGEMTGQEALDLGVRDAVYFEPTLIVNGTPAEITGTGGGVNPRTAIGQRADGAILFLVIDGRQPHSIGATLQDVRDVMMEYEAVNASNLDGGSSSVMVYEGELINVCSSLYGSRNQPAAFIVSREGSETE